jgi:hypothetical protein
MNRNSIIFASIFAVMIAVCGLYIVFDRIHAAGPDDDIPEIVYVDTKTGSAFLLASKTTPETHPTTGEKTLVPGLYCSECKAWKAVGPTENRQLRRKTQNCPIHKIPLTNDGPDPD